MSHEHQYRSSLAWSGSTASGYAGYDRNHTVATPTAEQPLALSSDASFRGDPTRFNPEQLLLAAASSCQLLAFLAVAARAGVDVRSYEDDAEAVMPVTKEPMQITQIVLRPHITVGPGVDDEHVRQLVQLAHDACYVANSLTTEVVIEPTIEH